MIKSYIFYLIMESEDKIIMTMTTMRITTTQIKEKKGRKEKIKDLF